MGVASAGVADRASIRAANVLRLTTDLALLIRDTVTDMAASRNCARQTPEAGAAFSSVLLARFAGAAIGPVTISLAGDFCRLCTAACGAGLQSLQLHANRAASEPGSGLKSSTERSFVHPRWLSAVFDMAKDFLLKRLQAQAHGDPTGTPFA